MSSAVRDEIFAIVAKAVGLSQEMLTDDMRLGQTPGWDSLVQVEIMSVLEERAGIEITSESIARFSSLEMLRHLFDRA